MCYTISYHVLVEIPDEGVDHGDDAVGVLGLVCFFIDCLMFALVIVIVLIMIKLDV